MLHTPIRNSGSSRYCGPTAIAAVTGLRGSDIIDAIRQARGNITTANGSNMPVAGMTNADLLATMFSLGWDIAEQWKEPDRRQRIEGRGVFAKFVRPEGFRPHAFREFLLEHGDEGPFIVNVTGHYIAVSQGELCDSDTCQLPTEIGRYLNRPKARYSGTWVKAWWRFTKAEQP